MIGVSETMAFDHEEVESNRFGLVRRVWIPVAWVSGLSIQIVRNGVVYFSGIVPIPPEA